jgi:predicted nucleic acid-binding protein
VEKKLNYFIVDACALIVYLRKEQGFDKFCSLLKDKNNIFYMHSINFGEVYYDTLRLSGEIKAKELFEDISKLPIKLIWHLDYKLLELAGKYKTNFHISYADSYVLALAEKENAKVITTDYAEFNSVEKENLLFFYWLRKPLG